MEIQSNVGGTSLISTCMPSLDPLTVSEDQLVQEQIPSHGSLPISDSMEEISVSSENGMANPIPETTVSPINKTFKSAKAGEKASQEAIKLWKENGFSR